MIQTQKTKLKYVLISITSLVGLAILALGFFAAYFAFFPDLVGPRKQINHLYDEIEIGDSYEIAAAKIEQAITADSQNILTSGQMGVYHLRDPYPEASGQLYISGAKGEFLCQGVIYYDADNKVIHHGDIRCID